MGKYKKSNVIFSGLIWTYMERILADTVSFIVSIILARLLDPEHYGEIAIVMVFMSIFQVFVTNGFGDIIVQKKEIDDNDINISFEINVFTSLIIYILLFLLAPCIAKFYSTPILQTVIRVMAIRIPISAYNAIQQAYISRNMEFKKFFRATLIGTIISAFIGVVLAYKGLGIWALVAQDLSNIFIDTLMLSFQIKWKPKLCFSREKINNTLRYGWKIVAYSLAGAIYDELRSFLVGKKYTANKLAFYNFGKRIPKLVVDNASNSIGKVLFPVYSKMQDDLEKLQNNIITSVKMELYIITPMLVGLSIVAPYLIEVAMTDKWLSSVFFVRIFCLCYLFKPITTTYMQVLRALGKNQIILRAQTFIIIINLIVIFISVFAYESAEAVAYGTLFSTIIGVIVYMIVISRELTISFIRQFKVIIQQMLYSLIMGAGVYLIKIPTNNLIILCIAKIVIGIFIYILLSKVFRINEFSKLITLLKSFKKHREI